jgi:hypothetical protein
MKARTFFCHALWPSEKYGDGMPDSQAGSEKGTCAIFAYEVRVVYGIRDGRDVWLDWDGYTGGCMYTIEPLQFFKEQSATTSGAEDGAVAERSNEPRNTSL